jgi:hypothetical protein
VLAAAATDSDPAAVLGEECHIIAQSAGGPRAGEISEQLLDVESNLTLLCRDDHRRVDAQPGHFSSKKLHELKAAHETWVHTTLEDKPLPIPPVRIRRVGPRLASIPMITSGNELLGIVMEGTAFDFAHDELTSENEVESVGSFLQTLQDYAEAGDDLESGERVRATFDLSKLLAEVTEAGFFVYGGIERHVLEGGYGPASAWPIARVRVRRASDMLAEALRQVQEDEAKASNGESGAGSAT